MKLFTDRHGQGLPRTKEVLDDESRSALWGLLANRIEEEWFGFSFPDKCPEGYVYAGTSLDRLQRDMASYKVLWPPDQLRANEAATDGQVFDAVEYSYQHVARRFPRPCATLVPLRNWDVSATEQVIAYRESRKTLGEVPCSV